MSISDNTSISRRYEIWYGARRLRLIVWLSSIVVYVLIVICLGDILEISSNYFVVIPLITTAFTYGMLGGVISGILALPANLFLFFLIGHMEYSPESHVIAESAGIIVGATLGFLGGRFRRLETEITNRIEIEQTLRTTLQERNLLIREIHHRVKNNLSVIRGMISLQQMNSENESSRAAFGDLANRLISLSLVQDQLNENTHFTQEIEVGEYLTQLISNIKQSFGSMNADIHLRIADTLPRINIDRIAPLGILVNEVVTNAFKHAFPQIERPMLRMDATQQGNELVIVIADNGPGYDGRIEEGPHLGRSMIDALSAQIRGKVVFDSHHGTTVSISMPIVLFEEDPDFRS